MDSKIDFEISEILQRFIQIGICNVSQLSELYPQLAKLNCENTNPFIGEKPTHDDQIGNLILKLKGISKNDQ